MLDAANQWAAQYGYPFVVGCRLTEGAGIPIRGERALDTAAAVAGHGTLHILGVIVAACVGTIAGGHVGYWIGSRGGATLLAKHGKWVGLNEARLTKTRTF